jgi:D-glycero-D-manno-heptose 1,7-bisphosphate phosphatase
MKLIIIDREGALCEPARGLDWSTQGLRLMPGAAEAIARLNHAGYRVALVQDDALLQQGRCDMDQMNRLHAELLDNLAREGARVDVMLFAQRGLNAHSPSGLTEAITDLMQRLRVTPAQTTFVSCSNDHLACASRAGCRAVQLLRPGILHSASLKHPSTPSTPEPASDALLRVDLGAVARELAH